VAKEVVRLKMEEEIIIKLVRVEDIIQIEKNTDKNKNKNKNNI
jgi:hypothetical protein